MLQNPTIIQLIVGIITLIIFYMGMYFWNLAEGKGTEKHRLFAIIFFIVTAVGLGYFFFNLITTTTYSWGSGFLASVKALLLIIIGVEIFLYSIDELEKGILQFTLIAIASVITLGIIAIGIEINHSSVTEKYEENIVEISDPRYEKEQYELVAEFNEDGMHAHSKISDNYKTITPYFRQYYNDDVEMYEFCYKVEDEVRYKEIKSQFLTLIPITDTEEPYYVVNRYVKYSLDYNNDPVTECNVSTSLSYELHVPKEYIELIQKQNLDKQNNKKE